MKSIFFLILILGILIILPVNAQYMGEMKTHQINIDSNEKQYILTYYSSIAEITNVKSDADALSMVFSVSSDDLVIDHFELQMSPDTFFTLLSRGQDCMPQETFLLIDGQEVDFIIKQEDDSITWKFDIPPKTQVIELIGALVVGQGPSSKIKEFDQHRYISSQQISIHGKFVDECGNPIKDGLVTLNIEDSKLATKETVSNDQGHFELRYAINDLGINNYKATIYASKGFQQSFQYALGFSIQTLEQKNIAIVMICDNDKLLVFKSSNNYPSCVKPQSITKLIERGWTSG